MSRPSHNDPRGGNFRGGGPPSFRGGRGDPRGPPFYHGRGVMGHPPPGPSPRGPMMMMNGRGVGGMPQHLPPPPGNHRMMRGPPMMNNMPMRPPHNNMGRGGPGDMGRNRGSDGYMMGRGGGGGPPPPPPHAGHSRRPPNEAFRGGGPPPPHHPNSNNGLRPLLPLPPHIHFGRGRPGRPPNDFFRGNHPPPPPPPGFQAPGRGFPAHPPPPPPPLALHHPPLLPYGNNAPGIPPLSGPPPFGNHSSHHPPVAVVAAATHNGRSLVSPPAPAPLTYSKEQLDGAWSEHTAPDGATKYYYNALSKQSIYHKPDAWSTESPPPVATAASSPWKEYTDPTSGKFFYSNGLATQWTKPDELAEADAPVNETPPDEPSSKKRKRIKLEFQSKDEAIEAFKKHLLTKEVLPSLKWTEAVKILSADDAWSDFEDALTVGERKQAMAEYQTKRANDLRTIERQERQRARESFQRMLAETVPSIPDFSGWKSRWADMRHALSKDPRFHAIIEEKLRETLFVDFCEEYRKRDDRRKRNLKREAESEFLSTLKELSAVGRVTTASTWSGFMASLSVTERSDKRLAVSEFISVADQQHIFVDCVTDLQLAEEEKKRKTRDNRRKTLQGQRDDFRDLLVRFAEEGNLLPSSLWRDSQDKLGKDPSYTILYEQSLDMPRELFQRFIEDWNEVYLRDRLFLSKIAASLPTKAAFVTDETSYRQFTEALVEASSEIKGPVSELRRIIDGNSPVSSAKLYFEELRNRAKLTASARRGSSRRRDDDSSEDEGEIVEEDTPENGDEEDPAFL